MEQGDLSFAVQRQAIAVLGHHLEERLGFIPYRVIEGVRHYLLRFDGATLCDYTASEWRSLSLTQHGQQVPLDKGSYDIIKRQGEMELLVPITPDLQLRDTLPLTGEEIVSLIRHNLPPSQEAIAIDLRLYSLLSCEEAMTLLR